MKTKFYLQLTILSLITCFSTAWGQCTNAANYGQYPNYTYINQNCDGNFEVIDDNCYAGEYSAVFITDGYTYEFGSSIGTDYLTIVQAANSNVLVHGTGTLTYLATFTGEIFFYTHTDAGCNESEEFRQRIISCELIIVPCLNAGTFGQFPLDTYDVPLCDGTTNNEISNSCYAGEYSKVNVIAGNTYTFSSSVLSDYLTISNDIGSIAYAAGTTPVTFLATTNQTLRFYTHTNSSCGEENSNRGRYVRCAAPEGCTNGVQWPLDEYTPAVCDGTTQNLINDDAYAGEYSLLNLLNTRTYVMSSSVATDYLTVTTADASTIVAHGPTPLTYMPATNGQYRFFIHTDLFCGGEQVNRDRRISCSTALETEEHNQPELSVYPNPATNSVTISASGPIGSIEVLSIDGKLLLHIEPTELSTTISIEELQSGTYFVRTAIGGVVTVSEWVKE